MGVLRWRSGLARIDGGQSAGTPRTGGVIDTMDDAEPVSPSHTEPSFPEHCVVELREAVDGRPAGASGTVVCVMGEPPALYMIEFDPFGRDGDFDMSELTHEQMVRLARVTWLPEPR